MPKGDSSSTNTKYITSEPVGIGNAPEMLLHPLQRQTRRQSHGHARGQGRPSRSSRRPSSTKRKSEACASCRKRRIRYGPPCAVCSPKCLNATPDGSNATRPAPPRAIGVGRGPRCKTPSLRSQGRIAGAVHAARLEAFGNELSWACAAREVRHGHQRGPRRDRYRAVRRTLPAREQAIIAHSRP